MREIKCRLDIPREWYERKLDEFIETNRYSAASHTRARLRYYDSHIEEAQIRNEFKKDCIELGAWKQVFREYGNNQMWHECCKVEKIVKEKGLNASPVVKHALEVIHRYFGG